MSVKAGYIYVLVHPAKPNLIKVGMTTRHPQERLKEHNAQFDKVVGQVVAETGEKWILKEYFAVKDTYNAESVFWHREPLLDIPGMLGNELLTVCDDFTSWEWVEEGLQFAREAGVRKDVTQPPIPKPVPKRGAKWIESQLEGTDLVALNGYGNGIIKKPFQCSNGHRFKIDGQTIAKFKLCPICHSDKYDYYYLRTVDNLGTSDF